MIHLIRNNRYIIKYPIAKEFIKFCIVGLSNLVIDMAGYYVLTRFAHLYYIIAGVISFTIAVTWSFYINSKWTFKVEKDTSWNRYIKFIVANLISMIISLSLLFMAVDILGWHDMMAKLVSAVFVAMLNFSINKYWTFGTRRDVG